MICTMIVFFFLYQFCLHCSWYELGQTFAFSLSLLNTQVQRAIGSRLVHLGLTTTCKNIRFIYTRGTGRLRV